MTDLPERRVVYVSPAFERLWGLDRRRLYDDPGYWPGVTHPNDRERVEAAFVERAGDGRFEEEYRIVLPDGAVRWVHDRGFPIKDATGRVHRIVGIAEDVTDRKRREERIGRLQTLTAALSAALDPYQVAEVIVEQARTMLGANQGVIGTVGDDGREFVTLRVVGYPPAVAAALQRLPIDAKTMFAEALRRRAPVFAETWAERAALAPHFARTPVVGGRGAGAVVPLAFEGRQIGAIGFGFPTDRAFDAEERDFLRAIADLCAQALERARLYEAERHARAAAEESEDRFRATFDQAAVGIGHAALDGRWLRVNQTLCEILGFTRDELLARTFQDVTHPDDLEAGLGPVRRLVAGEIGAYNLEKRYVRKDGSAVWVEITTTLARPPAGPPYFIGVVQDIAARRRTAEALHQSEARLRFVLDAARLGEWDLDLATLVARRSPRHDQIFGYDDLPPDWTYDRFLDHVLPEDRAAVDASFRQTLATGEPWRFESRIARADGQIAWIEARGRVYLDDAGTPRRMLGTVEDITERKLGEAERRAFVDAVAHDLRNPLGAVKAQAQLLRRRIRRAGAVDAAVVDAGLDGIETGVNRTTALIDEMLDAAYLHAGRPLELRPAPTDLVALVRAAVADAQRATTRHAIRLHGDAALVGNWDRSRLERVLTNLLGNAIKYSPAGGEIVVRLRRADEADGAWAVLTVADRGIGIPASDLPHVFERFRRGANVRDRIAGSGIGLSGAKQVVEQHGGTIAVASEEGAGSTVTVRLPLADRLGGAAP